MGPMRAAPSWCLVPLLALLVGCGTPTSSGGPTDAAVAADDGFNDPSGCPNIFEELIPRFGTLLPLAPGWCTRIPACPTDAGAPGEAVARAPNLGRCYRVCPPQSSCAGNLCFVPDTLGCTPTP